MTPEISPDTVKELRKRTQAGFVECKKALEESGGDIEQAIAIIRKRGMALANKRASRSATEGVIGVTETKTAQGTQVVLFELNSETDFVAKNDMFQKGWQEISTSLQNFLGKQGLNKSLSLSMIQELKLSGKIVPESKGLTVGDFTKQLTGTIGEKIELSNVRSLLVPSGEHAVTYIHAGNKVASVVHLSAPNAPSLKLQEVGKDVAMQVVASAPTCLTEKDVPKDDLEKEKDVYLAQAMQSGKPKEIAEKMVLGKLKSYYKQICLVEQPFIKDPKLSVTQYLEQRSKELGQKIEVRGFIRLACGEKHA